MFDAGNRIYFLVAFGVLAGVLMVYLEDNYLTEMPVPITDTMK